eukprot:1452194-Heterocapsa_arctica.AAC.1
MDDKVAHYASEVAKHFTNNDSMQVMVESRGENQEVRRGDRDARSHTCWAVPCGANPADSSAGSNGR